jgi:two-component system, chemotaxis family, response regulator Rcp1
MSPLHQSGELRRVPQVLVVDDSEDDYVLAREGFYEAGIQVGLHHVENGAECMRYLRHDGHYSDMPSADLILLDLNMPVMDGRQVLAELVNDPKLKHLPVIVMTTSAASDEVLSLYRLRCSAFMIKPTDFFEFVRQLKVLSEYWFTVIQLPPAVNGRGQQGVWKGH